MKLVFRETFTAESEYDRIFSECIRMGMMLNEAAAQIARLKRQRTYRDRDDIYQVATEDIGNPFGIENGDMIWLSIKRVDRQVIHDWREFQKIKNALVGDECEGFEIYPAESRLVDTSNQFHLWVFKSPKVSIPVGWKERLVMGPDPRTKAKQRAF